VLSGGGELLAGGNSCGVGEGLAAGVVFCEIGRVDFLAGILWTDEAVVFLDDLATGAGTR